MPKKTRAPAPKTLTDDDSVIEYDEAPGRDDQPVTAARETAGEAEPDDAPDAPPEAPAPTPEPATGKLARLEALLLREGGATLAQMVEETGWQEHSVRGALAGGLKKRGLTITSQKPERVYRAERAEASVQS